MSRMGGVVALPSFVPSTCNVSQPGSSVSEGLGQPVFGLAYMHLRMFKDDGPVLVIFTMVGPSEKRNWRPMKKKYLGSTA